MGNQSSTSPSAGSVLAPPRRVRWLQAVAALFIAAGVLYASALFRTSAPLAQGWLEPPATLLMLALLAMTFAHGCGYVARRLGLPSLVGQVMAGLLLGPALLGWLWPESGQSLLPASLRTVLAWTADAAIALYLLRVALQSPLSPPAPARTLRVVPGLAFALGAVLVLVAYPWFGATGMAWVPLALIVGCSFALRSPAAAADPLDNTTPALSRWAQARREAGEPYGWLLPLLAAMVLLGNRFDPIAAIGYALGIGVAAALLVRPWLARQAGRDLSARLAIKIALLVIAAAALVEPLGLPSPFGALVFGLLLPAARRPAQILEHALLRPLQKLLLPAFFLGIGLRVEPAGLTVATLPLIGAAIAIAWIAGFATALGARPGTAGVSTTLAATAAFATPGALALYALQLGLDRGVLPPAFYTALVVAALISAVLAALMARPLFPPRRAGARRCVLLYRIAP